jgi:hypothetical protein
VLEKGVTGTRRCHKNLVHWSDRFSIQRNDQSGKECSRLPWVWRWMKTYETVIRPSSPVFEVLL